MDVSDRILILMAIWTVLVGILAKSFDLFVSLELVGISGLLTIHYYHLSSSHRIGIRPLLDLLLILFTIATLRQIYTIISTS